MKIITFILTFFIISLNALSRGIGETEITTDDGIEVFQNEKYYLLKKNVKIVSDDFEISADNVKANFEEDLYDIISIHANGNSILNAKKYGLYGTTWGKLSGETTSMSKRAFTITGEWGMNTII